MMSQPHDVEELIKTESSHGSIVFRQINQAISRYPQPCQQTSSFQGEGGKYFLKYHLTTLKSAKVIQRQEYVNELK
jgi:hypothetical protein